MYASRAEGSKGSVHTLIDEESARLANLPGFLGILEQSRIGVDESVSRLGLDRVSALAVLPFWALVERTVSPVFLPRVPLMNRRTL